MLLMKQSSTSPPGPKQCLRGSHRILKGFVCRQAVFPFTEGISHENVKAILKDWAVRGQSWNKSSSPGLPMEVIPSGHKRLDRFTGQSEGSHGSNIRLRGLSVNNSLFSLIFKTLGFLLFTLLKKHECLRAHICSFICIVRPWILLSQRNWGWSGRAFLILTMNSAVGPAGNLEFWP